MQTQGSVLIQFNSLHDFTRYVGRPIYNTYKNISDASFSDLAISLKINPQLISTLSRCTTVQHWDAEMETSHVSVVQAHFAPHSTDVRHLPTGHYRWQGMMLPVFFPAFQITIAIHQKAILWGQTWCSSFICSPTALLFCTGLEMAVFLCQDLDAFKTILPFKEPYIFIVNQN